MEGSHYISIVQGSVSENSILPMKTMVHNEASLR